MVIKIPWILAKVCALVSLNLNINTTYIRRTKSKKYFIDWKPPFLRLCWNMFVHHLLLLPHVTLAQGNWTGCFAARFESNGLWTSHTLLLQLPERDTDMRYLAGFPTPELYSPTSKGRAFTKPTPLSYYSPSFHCFHRAFLLFIHQLLGPPINLGYRWSQSHPASFTKFAWRACGGGTRIQSAELWLCSRARYR